MGRGRGTVPRGMGAVVEAMVGVFGGRAPSGRVSDVREGGAWWWWCGRCRKRGEGFDGEGKERRE